MPTRPCDFCLGLQDDSVFADFSRDKEGRLFLNRISLDGFGCQDSIEGVLKMSIENSEILTNELQQGTIGSPVAQHVLRHFFELSRTVLWEDALLDHSLINKTPGPPSVGGPD